MKVVVRPGEATRGGAEGSEGTVDVLRRVGFPVTQPRRAPRCRSTNG